jgi:uncharacterized damage-inducible protein DinB
MKTELEEFLRCWEQQAEGTIALMRALPCDEYDFRPDAGGRSLGELAWHLAEVDAYVSLGIELGEVRLDVKPPHIERPRTVKELAPAFRVVHDEAAARIAPLQTSDLDRVIRDPDGQLVSIRNALWDKMLTHGAHHRGQLMLLCRLAGGLPPALFGPTREERGSHSGTPSEQ